MVVVKRRSSALHSLLRQTVLEPSTGDTDPGNAPQGHLRSAAVSGVAQMAAPVVSTARSQSCIWGT